MAGKQLGNCLHNWVPAHRWQPHWQQAAPPPESEWAPVARPERRAGAVPVVHRCSCTPCSPQVGLWMQSRREHCEHSAATKTTTMRNKRGEWFCRTIWTYILNIYCLTIALGTGVLAANEVSGRPHHIRSPHLDRADHLTIDVKSCHAVLQHSLAHN